MIDPVALIANELHFHGLCVCGMAFGIVTVLFVTARTRLYKVGWLCALLLLMYGIKHLPIVSLVNESGTRSMTIGVYNLAAGVIAGTIIGAMIYHLTKPGPILMKGLLALLAIIVPIGVLVAEELIIVNTLGL